jgi:hypothetical protein
MKLFSVVPLLLMQSTSIHAFSILSIHSTNSVTKKTSILWYTQGPGPGPGQEGPEESSQEETLMMNYYDNYNNNYNNLVITSPVLKQVYPSLLEWKQTYGHPNIPLGTKEGRQCQTLRRLHLQDKLKAEEVTSLKQLGFIFTSLEDLYREADFNDMWQRLMAYEQDHPHNHFQIAKKCPSDPELGAWVTGIRRLGPDGVDPGHAQTLNDAGFAWISTRKCGSRFMDQYRQYIDQVSRHGRDAVRSQSQTVTWIKAQQEACKRGTLSQTRVHYLRDLFGDDWMTVGQ